MSKIFSPAISSPLFFSAFLQPALRARKPLHQSKKHCPQVSWGVHKTVSPHLLAGLCSRALSNTGSLGPELTSCNSRQPHHPPSAQASPARVVGTQALLAAPGKGLPASRFPLCHWASLWRKRPSLNYSLQHYEIILIQLFQYNLQNNNNNNNAILLSKKHT